MAGLWETGFPGLERVQMPCCCEYGHVFSNSQKIRKYYDYFVFGIPLYDGIMLVLR